jgi:hypothetical protein
MVPGTYLFPDENCEFIVKTWKIEPFSKTEVLKKPQLGFLRLIF